ncbi:hypothetical protein EVG20_g10715 [Dentipellis fragilis]|uniref:Uncharacterized protein n=1 Tax=Dentipellis fragilis TaxID=205917 RepID=A0A4Y9XSD0_9AGAM|nr:hypothetical protein EVG20_g10715 [Dentipellis fragilis]
MQPLEYLIRLFEPTYPLVLVQFAYGVKDHGDEASTMWALYLQRNETLLSGESWSIIRMQRTPDDESRWITTTDGQPPSAIWSAVEACR